MKATTDMVLTKDRKRAVPLGDPDGDPFAWVASKGEEVPNALLAEKQERPKVEVKLKTPKENK
jgi:hypothetical protein